MKRGRLTALLLLPALLAGCAPSAAWSPPAGVTALTTTEEMPGNRTDFAPQPAADAAIGALGADLLRAVRTPGENTLLSPLSVALALSMTANGAAGDTLAELEALLGAEADVLNANAGSLLDDYLALEGGTERAIANSLWMDDGLEAEEEFLERCAAFYQAEVYQTDLPTEETRDAVNDWIGRVTRGMIPQMLSQPPREDAALLLVNALYMKNTWAEEFDASDTRPRVFAAGGAETEIDFLFNGVRTERYFRTENAAGAVLPYDDGRLAFVAVLPDGELDAWLEGLDGETFSALIGAAEETETALYLPRFEAEWGGGLTDALRALGLDAAFDPARADFSRMGTAGGAPLFLGAVDHRAKIEVTETGTEAAAATVVTMPAAGVAPGDPPVELVFDRPFCYAVVDLERGVPLFLGTYERP